MGKRNASDGQAREGGFDMTPMIDVTFLLIVFFMCVTEMSDNERSRLDLPEATMAETVDHRPGRLVLNILRDGSVEVGHVRYEDDDLKRLLEYHYSMYLQDGSPHSRAAVLVRADERAEYGAVQRVMVMCMNANVWRIAFATRDPQNLR